jgi:hypothetical protein
MPAGVKFLRSVSIAVFVAVKICLSLLLRLLLKKINAGLAG